MTTTSPTTPVTGEVLTKLAEMLAKATAANMRLDAMIHAMFVPADFLDEDAAHYATYPEVNRADMRYLRDMMVPSYTASIDAALALVESMLPDWGGAILSWSGGGKYPVFRMERSYPTNVEVAVEAHTRPLAILSALVNALAASLIPTKENDDVR